MNPRELGMSGDEIVSINRDMGDAAKEAKRLYFEILRSGGTEQSKEDFLAALLRWRDAVASRT